MTTTTTNLIGHDDDVNWAARGSVNNCVQCGRKTSANAKWVQIYNGGQVFAKSEGIAERNGGWMGWFPVGSECAKQFAAGVLYNAAENDNCDAPHKMGGVA
jgi:hypothetical protein